MFTPVKLHFPKGTAAVHLQRASRGPAEVHSIAALCVPQTGGLAGWSSKHVVGGKV